MLQDVIEAATTPWVVAVAAGAVTVVALVAVKMKRPRRCTSEVDLTGKTAIVTGANTGIGYWTALDFAARNAHVILACRSKERAQVARDKIVAATGNKNVVVQIVDLASLASVRQFVSEFKERESRLDILVNNAGVFGVPQERNDDGLELNMAANHFGPFLLTMLLIDLLKKSAPSRIVNVSSQAHTIVKESDFDNLNDAKPVAPIRKYATTKAANILFSRKLSQHLDGTGVSVYCVHPGAVRTEIGRNMPLWLKILFSPIMFFMKTAEDGAQTSIYCAVTKGIENLSGKYFMDCQCAENSLSKVARDAKLADNLWQLSLRATGLGEGM